MTIGEFGEKTRLSPKALRLYDQLGLVIPAQVGAASGYRRYSEDQVDTAQLLALLRRLDMPLADIAAVLALEEPEAARAVTSYWAQVEAAGLERRALVSYLRARLTGEQNTMYDINVRTMPERKILSITRHVHTNGTDAFFHHAFPRLRAAAPGLEGIAGVPFLGFYGEVSDDSDGPMELCRPVDAATGSEVSEEAPDIQLRVEPAHDEAYIRLRADEITWPEMLPAVDALGRWVTDAARQPLGTFRQLLIADQRTAPTDTFVCDLTFPLRLIAPPAG